MSEKAKMSQRGTIRRQQGRDQLSGFLVVAVSMAAMYTVPGEFFVPVVFVSTTCMILITYHLTRYSKLFRPGWRNVGFGLVSAVLLYGIFLLGNYGIKTLHPFGISPSAETSIYSVITTHALPLQVAILLFDAFGFESYFRGVLQNYFLAKSKGRLKVGACFASALVDALIHLISLNPLWVITTFIADSVWGLTYYYTRDLSSSVTSHFVWDIAIFLIFPIK